MNSRTAIPETESSSIDARLSTGASPVIQLQNLRHQYDDRTALAGVSLEVRPAEIFGLLGPNGSGKTTTFRILSTLIVPSGGRALIMGYDVAKDPGRVRREIGVVFQEQSIDVKLSAEENLMLIGNVYGLHGTALRNRVAEMLARVGLTDRAKERAETFSGGMKRRLELAKGLLHHPSVLLLDEPTTGLDPGARRDLWQYLHMLRNEEHVSVLVTTHLMEEAERLCDRVAIIEHGKVIDVGTPRELVNRHCPERTVVLATENSSAPEFLRAIPCVESVTAQNSQLTIQGRGEDLVTDVIHCLSENRIRVTDFRTVLPNLEDVFLRLTGHSIRD